MDLLSRIDADIAAQRAAIEAAEKRIAELTTARSVLEGYEGGPSEIIHASPTVTIRRRMTVRVPREGTTRWEIGLAALRAIKLHGPMTTKQLLPFIPPHLLANAATPINYLSNALSKDARLSATSEGWTKAETEMASPSEEAI